MQDRVHKSYLLCCTSMSSNAINSFDRVRKATQIRHFPTRITTASLLKSIRRSTIWCKLFQGSWEHSAKCLCWPHRTVSHCDHHCTLLLRHARRVNDGLMLENTLQRTNDSGACDCRSGAQLVTQWWSIFRNMAPSQVVAMCLVHTMPSAERATPMGVTFPRVLCYYLHSPRKAG
jgi:hypothetical protein